MRPRLPEETYMQALELLLSDWTPQEIADSGLVSASQAFIHLLARAHGLNRRPGGQPGRSRQPGAGRPKGSIKTADMRIAVRALREAGLSWDDIASKLNLKSRQHAHQLSLPIAGEQVVRKL